MSTTLKYVLFHLPKTGGTSLFRAFQDWCGQEACHQMIRKELPESLQTIGPGTEVINGHFDYKHLVEAVDVEHLHLITFLRDPVERVVSNYHFFLKTLRAPLPHRLAEARANQHRLGESLLEYADQNRNIMAGRLAGAEPANFAFIGELSRMEEDLNAIAKKFGLPQRRAAPIENVGQYTPPSASERNQIAAWNQWDLELYRHWSEAARKVNMSFDSRVGD